MNKVTLDEISDELFGSNDEQFRRLNLDHIYVIQRWLGISGKRCYQLDDRLRLACSIVTRAELQLFGLSAPRFAVRLYADDAHRSFFNLRRSSLLASNIIADGGWAKRQARDNRRIEEATEFAEGEVSVEKPFIIGDSLFAVPDRFAKRYFVLTSEFHSAYGEPVDPDLPEEKYQTTPYVQHFWATGLCAHAVVYMASMVLEKYVISVHALAEVAALLSLQAKDEVLIAGLSPSSIEEFFAHKEVGLKAYYQHSPSHGNFGTGLPFNQNLCHQNALRSYLLSRMPVIKHVDLGRLHGIGNGFTNHKAIYQRNKTGFNPTQFKPTEAEPHCVVLVGCSINTADDFLLHDPSGVPYMEANTSELMNASSYITMPPLEAPGAAANLTQLFFQPITPELVAMPLHTQKRGPDDIPLIGLYQIAMHFYTDLHDELLTEHWPTYDELLTGEFRLVKARDLEVVLVKGRWTCGEVTPEMATAVCQLREQLYTSNPEHWLWVQKFSGSFWIWDAQATPPSQDDHHLDKLDKGKYLVAIVGAAGQTHMFRNIPHERQPASRAEVINPQPHAEDKHLDLALLSSFNFRGLCTSLENWPEGLTNAELYAFMLQDVKDLLLPDSSARYTAVQAMAKLCDDTRETARIGAKIHELFSVRGINIRSFATFIPELFDARESVRQIAGRSIKFLCQLASELRKKQHTVNTIEIVGGSVIRGALPVEYCEHRCLLANRKVFESLDADTFLLREIGMLFGNDLVTHDVRIAIEAEPGFLFAFRNEAAIDGLVSRIDMFEASDILKPGRVGLNLDIGHWMLSRIPASKLDDPRIARRVFNAHISDHAKGHFGDSIVGTIHKEPEFKQWIQKLKNLSSGTFSRSVSVEFECVKSLSVLNEAIKRVQKLF